MRDLRHHPLILGAELALLVGIGALLYAHLGWQNKLADAPRAFVTTTAEGALLERLSLRGAVYVNAEFHHKGRVVTDDEGVRSVMVPPSSPARIFKLQPDDRKEAWQRTPGLDFFLEGCALPHAGKARRGAPTVPGRSAPCLLEGSLDGAGSDLPRAYGGSERILLDGDGNDRVYVIDGNLWLHSHDALELRLATVDGAPVRVTFVVRGNIYFLDDVRAQGPGGSIAFIALPAPTFLSSGGDIWLGDLAYGTLSHVDGLLFASGDIDGALYGEGLVVNGALAAGGGIRVHEGGGCRPSPLRVQHDLRYGAGKDLPPGL